MNLPRQHHYLVVYDLSCDRERRHVDRLLLGWGERVQKSVFKVVTTRLGAQQLHGAIGKLTLQSGNVQLHRLLPQTQPIVLGSASQDDEPSVAFIY